MDKPIYTATTFKDLAKTSERVVREAIKTFGPGGVAIIAPSVKVIKNGRDTNPLTVLSKNLADIPMFISDKDDDAKIDEKLLHGKLLFATFNSMKGRERDCVIVVGLDETYFKYYNREWKENGTAVPNILYVAATRARRRLIIIASARETLRSIKVEKLGMTATLIGGKISEPKVIPPAKETARVVSVRDLIAHQNVETTKYLVDSIEMENTRLVAAPPVFPSMIIKFDELYEDVSALYGTVIPTLVELDATGETPFLDKVAEPKIIDRREEERLYPNMITILRSHYNYYPKNFWDDVKAISATAYAERKLSDWFKLAVAKNAVEGGMFHMARQLRDYKWIDEKFVESARKVVYSAIKPSLPGAFEARICDVTIDGITIVGRADFVSADGCIWEFKCCKESTDDHFMQLGCYIAASEHKKGCVFTFLGGQIEFVSLNNPDKFLPTAIKKYKPRPEQKPIEVEIAEFQAKYGTGNSTTIETTVGENPTDSCEFSDADIWN